MGDALQTIRGFLYTYTRQRSSGDSVFLIFRVDRRYNVLAQMSPAKGTAVPINQTVGKICMRPGDRRAFASDADMRLFVSALHRNGYAISTWFERADLRGCTERQRLLAIVTDQLLAEGQGVQPDLVAQPATT